MAKRYRPRKRLKTDGKVLQKETDSVTNAYDQRTVRANDLILKLPKHEPVEELSMMDKLYIRRANLLKDSDKDKNLQKALVIKCSDGYEGLLFWIEHFVWIYEPRVPQGQSPTIPMTMEGDFAYQKDILKKVYECITQEKDLHIEKSRDMGLSWLMLVVCLWGWRFHGWECLIGSKTADDVDKLGNMKTLLPKVRFMIRHMPKWMWPRYFQVEKNMGWMNIQNPEMGCSISGQANAQNFATGTRNKVIIFDEFAKWEHTDRNAWTSAGAAAPCRIAVSTPFFKNNKFFELIDEKSGEKTIERLKVHYKLNPKKADDKWIDKEKSRYTEEEWSQEFEISYSGTTYSGVYSEEMRKMRQENRISPNATYFKGRPIYCSMDFGMGDSTAMTFFQMTLGQEEINLFECYDNKNKPIEHYINWVKDPDRVWNIREDGKYCEGWRDITLIPDPNQATNREMQTGKTLQQYFENADIPVEMRWIGTQEGISATKRLLQTLRIKPGLRVLDALDNYHYKYDNNRGEYKREPVHDWSSHFCDAVKYFAAYVREPELGKVRDDDEYSNSDIFQGASPVTGY